VLVLHLLLH
jgi:hypothetical protein